MEAYGHVPRLVLSLRPRTFGVSAGAGEAVERALETSKLGSPLQELLGYRLVEWETDWAAIAYVIDPAHLNRVDRLHGGVLATLLDAACGFSGCYSSDPTRPLACVTLSLTVNYVASVTAGRLVAEGRRTGGGRMIFFAEGAVRDESGRLIASSTGAFRYLKSPFGGD